MKTPHTYANENEPLSFIALAAVTANVVLFLQTCENHKEDGKRQSETDRKEQQREEDQRRYVEKRLADIAEFERRANGGQR